MKHGLLVLTVVVGMFGASAVVADDKPTKPNGVMSITGQGTVQAEPDEGYVTIGIVTVEPTAGAALTANAKSTAAVFQALATFGIDKKTFQTQEFRLQQNFKQVKEGDNVKNVPDGYLVGHLVQVTVCNLKDFGAVLDAVVSSGVNQVYNISFGSSKAKEKTDAARSAATQDALKKARQIADELGQTIVGIQAVQESSGLPRQPQYARMAPSDEAAGGTQVSGGTLSFHSSVSVTFEIIKGPERVADQVNPRNLP